MTLAALVAGLLLSANPLFAANAVTGSASNAGTSTVSSPGSTPGAGTVSQELTQDNFRADVCNIASMKVNFKISESYGQLLVNTRLSWTAGSNTAPDCLSTNTQVWVTLRTPDDAIRYIKLNPGIVDAGQGFGPSGSTSPSWSALFCRAQDSNAACEPETNTRSLLNAALRFERFDVVTEARSLSNLTKTVSRPAESMPAPKNMAFDTLLQDAINNAYAPREADLTGREEQPGKDTAKAKSPAATPTAAVFDSSNPVVTDSVTAKATVDRVVALLASSLSQYTIAPHSCESARTVSQWVQARGECEFNFRSESNHEFLCEDDGKPQSIRATDNARINLATDVAAVADIRLSDDGWAALVLELNSDLHSHSDARFKSNRWQITTGKDQLKEMQELARSLVALKNYCSAVKSS